MRWAFLLALPVAAGLYAEVADAGPNGFVVKSTWTIKAQPEVVYGRFMNNVGDWWNAAHTWSGDARNLSIEARVNGCFCEKLANNGGVRHLQIVYLDPGKVVRFTGGLGPFQAMAVTGALTIEFKPAAEGSTTLTLTYTIGGYMDKAPRIYAGMADGMLAEQFGRFKAYVETGSPVVDKL